MAETRIREALELLRRDGWWGGIEGPSGSGECAGLALAKVHGYQRDGRVTLTNVIDDPIFEQDARTLSTVVLEHYPERAVDRSPEDVGALVAFNNNTLTTFADVELVMEKAAVMREESVDG